MKKILTLITFCLFHFSILFAQCCPYLGDISIIPEDPTTTDSIYLVTNVTTPNQGSYLGYDIFELPNDLILVEACYWEGSFTAVQTFVDTINLGLLPIGTNDIRFKAISSDNSVSCNPIDSNTVTIELEVSDPIPTQEVSDVSAVRCFPNPVSNNLLYIQSKQTIKELEIINAIGLRVIQKSNLLKKNLEIDMSRLSNGIYFTKTTNINNKITIQKIIKNN